MKLFLDIGNSRLKWLLFSNRKENKNLIARKGSILIEDIESSNIRIEKTSFFQQIIRNIKEIKKEKGEEYLKEKNPLEHIIWICVAPKKTENKAFRILSKLYGREPPRKLTTPKKGKLTLKFNWGIVEVKCGYNHPSRLGSDRWSALVGLAALGPPSFKPAESTFELILVSAGTATVIDKVFWQRVASRKWICELKGGIIFPGFNKMLSNMNFIQKKELYKKSVLKTYPQNTIDAIKTGIASCQVVLEKKDCHKTIIVHGGDSEKWIESYEFFNPSNKKPLEMPWIVFEGLYLINEQRILKSSFI